MPVIFKASYDKANRTSIRSYRGIGVREGCEILAAIGAPSSLAQLIRHLDPRFEPHVFCPKGPAADLFAEAGAIVHTGDVSIFAHAWDSPYEGLRWLVVGREVAALPPHLRQLDRLMRQAMFTPERWDTALFVPPLKSRRLMTSGANTITYSLYKDSGRTSVWGNTVGTDTQAAEEDRVDVGEGDRPAHPVVAE